MSEASQTADNGPVGFIAFCRWSSALIVALSHARALNIIGYDGISGAKAIFAPFYLVTSLGMQSVMVFFILSGYLVGGKAFERAMAGNFSPKSYVIDRSTRIYCVLLPALLLTFVLDRSGQLFGGAAGLYDGSAAILAGRFDNAFAAADNWPSFVCNVVQAQPLHCPPFGSNVPLWSLSLEVWYYVVAGAAAATLQARSPWRIILTLAALVLTYLFTGPRGLTLGALWLLGAVIYLCRTKPMPRLLAIPVVALGVFLLALLASARISFAIVWGPVSITMTQLLAGLGFAILLNAVVRSQRASIFERHAAIYDRLAGSSFSLYLTHVPVIAFCYSLLITRTALPIGAASGYQPIALNLAAMMGSVAVAVLFAALFAGIFERGSYRVRALLKRASFR